MPRDRPNVVSVRFSDDELEAMKVSAARHERKLSDHAREMALIGELRCRPGVEVTRLSSGAELTVFPAQPVVTNGV
jgi:plasmid stability protein